MYVVFLSGFNRICDKFYLNFNKKYIQHIVKKQFIDYLRFDPIRTHQIEQNC